MKNPNGFSNVIEAEITPQGRGLIVRIGPTSQVYQEASAVRPWLENMVRQGRLTLRELPAIDTTVTWGFSPEQRAEGSPC